MNLSMLARALGRDDLALILSPHLTECVFNRLHGETHGLDFDGSD
jgi:hypothetical protein